MLAVPEGPSRPIGERWRSAVGSARSLVTYYGNPLCRYKGDTKPGQTNGEDKNKTWYVVTQFGQPLTPPGY